MNDKTLAILSRDETPAGPHGWIQWKGTNVCMDVRCECGELTHFDGEYCYFIECGACHRRYMAGAHVKLYPLTNEESDHVAEEVVVSNP